MPNSPHSAAAAVAVRTYVASVLPGAQLDDAHVSPDYPPLLLLRTSHVMAAFAFANGDMRGSYETLYGGFKRHYGNQRGGWDALDLAFVFCIPANTSQLDQFCSHVETDVYFCRKFVVPLNGSVGPPLSRLPFLPLTPVAGQSLRPPSAQTLLQQCGVPAVLAKYLVVQHERSPEGIVEDSATGEFGEPRPLAGASAPLSVQAERTAEAVRLDSLQIRNFRAYRRPQTFALGADVTVLYGPNGFGKTSFFDAIDFAITGGIGRIDFRRQSDFPKTARHLDARDEESAVTLTFQSRGVIRKIVRTVRDRKQALLDDRPTDRKAVLTALTGSDIPPTDRVENLVSLFRASHLFSQEQQELTKNFQDDCRLSADIVSRMLAFDDYANAVNKVSKVREVLQNVIAVCADEIRILGEQIAVDNRELARLGETARTHANPEALAAELEAMRVKLAAVGIAAPATKVDVAVVRSWRATIEAKLAQSRTTGESVTILAGEVARAPRARDQLTIVQQQVATKEAALKAAEEKRGEIEEAIRQLESLAASLTAKRTEAQSRSDVLTWIRSAQPEYRKLLDQQRQLGADIERTNGVLAQLQTAEDKSAGELRAQEAAMKQLTEGLTARTTELATLQSFCQTIPAWQASRARLAAVAQGEQAHLMELEAARSGVKELTPLHAAAVNEEQRLVRKIAETDRNHSELRTLVSQLQGHVRSGTCPLCGQDHGSQDQLLRRIQAHVAADAASAARADLSAARAKVSELGERLAATRQKQTAAETQLAGLKSERDRLQGEIAQFTASASKLAIALKAAGPTPAEQAESFLKRLHDDLADLEKRRQEAMTGLEAARLAASNARSGVAARKTEIDQQRSALKRAQEESNCLRGDPRLTHVALDIEAGQLTELERSATNQIELLRAEAAKNETEIGQKKKNLGVLRSEIASLKAQLGVARTQAASLLKDLAQIAARLGEAALPADSTENSLLALVAAQSSLQAQLVSLRESASGLELALDAATTAAALTTLRQTVRNREKAVADATAKRGRHAPWLKYYDEVARLLSSQQSEAIANFTREYGPRTSTIQRRLRSVYGFDDVQIRSRDATISVRIMRNGEELRPVDYFSQSQQQTLLLGLFLTACSSQTWSAFSPVLLDDPVTHFDDLNTYAFLDLVVGLLESGADRRQFILSTCDEKLLQLARQKFRHLGERARFYRFTAIGADGPNIDEIGST